MPRKSTKSGPTDDDRPTYLAKPMADVAAVLDDRITKGRDLQSQLQLEVLSVPGRMQELKEAHRSWDSYNATYLERAFTTKELFSNYTWWPGIAFGGPISDADRLQDLRQDLERDLGILTRLRDELSLYEPPDEQAPAIAVASMPTRYRDVHIHIERSTVGQLNLGDMIGDIETHLKSVSGPSADDMSRVIKQLVEAVLGDAKLPEHAKRETIQNIELIAAAAAEPPAKRKLGPIKAVLTATGGLLAAGSSAMTIWEGSRPLLHRFFGI